MIKVTEITRYALMCECCHRMSHFTVTYTQVFNAGYDWEDSLSETICLWCDAKDRIRAWRRRTRETLRGIRFYFSVMVLFVFRPNGKMTLKRARSMDRVMRTIIKEKRWLE